MQTLIDTDGEVTELTKSDLEQFKPASEVLPANLLSNLKKMRGSRGKQKSPTKVITTIRFDADLLEELKASGRGWQTRVNDILRKQLLESHKS